MTKPFPPHQVCENCPPPGAADHARCTACPHHSALIAPPPKPTPGGLHAADVARAFEVMLPSHRADLYLQHNPHLDPEQSISVKTYTAKTSIGFVNELERQKAEKTNEMWILCWRPADEPVGSPHLSIAACSLAAIGMWLQDHEMAFGS